MTKKQNKRKKINQVEKMKNKAEQVEVDKVEVEEISIEDALKKEDTFIQQTFNFENSQLEDKNINSKNIDNQVKVEEIPLNLDENKKRKYPLKTVLSLVLVIFMLSSFIVYHFTTFDHSKKEEVKKAETIVFLGDSITNGYKLDSHFKKYEDKYNIVNSGINGNITDEVLIDLKHRALQYNPSKVFLLIGTNDIGVGKDINHVIENIDKIVKEIKENNNKTEIYIESIYPVDEEQDAPGIRSNSTIKELNKNIKKYCKNQDKKVVFVDCYDELVDDSGLLKDEYTYDGLHLTEKGYDIVTNTLEKYI